MFTTILTLFRSFIILGFKCLIPNKLVIKVSNIVSKLKRVIYNCFKGLFKRLELSFPFKPYINDINNRILRYK
jgi:hypothetical protein